MENKDYKPRNLIEIADKIIEVISSHSNLKKERADMIINQIEKVKKNYSYSDPEITYLRWEELADILNRYFIPSNSRWETEIMIIFNNLSGTVKDYYQN